MPRGEKINPQRKEEIRAHYAVTQSLAATAKHFGVSSQSVMKIRDEKPDELEEMRTYNKELFIRDAWDSVGQLMAIIPAKAIDAPLSNVTTAIGILIDKMQLLTGEATTRSENANRNVHSLDDLSAEQAALIVKMYAKGTGDE